MLRRGPRVLRCSAVAAAPQHVMRRALIDAAVTARVEAKDGGEVLNVQALWPTAAASFKLVDEFNVGRPRRRRTRVGSMLRFLTDHNVLLHSCLRWDPLAAGWNVSPEFLRLTRVGERHLRDEALVRGQRLLPGAAAPALAALRDEAVSEAELAALFDAMELGRLVAKEHRRQKPLTAEHKSRVLLAAIAELHWFVVKTKATDRTHNNALFPPSDALILHVLAAHALESLCADAVFRLVHPRVQAHRPRWVNYTCSTPLQFQRRPPLLRSAAIDAAARQPTEREAERRATAAAQPALAPPLPPQPTRGFTTPTDAVFRWERLGAAHGVQGPRCEQEPLAAAPTSAAP